MRIAIIAASAALASMSTTAYAADVYSKGGSMKDGPVSYDSPKTWTGFYIGVGVGAGASNTELSLDGPDRRVLEVERGDFDSVELFGIDGIGGEGAFGTVQVGYDRQLSSRFVIGAFADYDFSGISSEVRLLGESAEIDLDHTWSIGARAGFLANPDTLVYALVAYTQGEYDISELGGGDLEVEGWSFGGGIETRLADNWTLKGEYRYTQFDEENIAEFGPFSLDAEPSLHTARVVLSYRINPFHEVLDASK